MLRSLILVHTLLSMQEDDDSATLLNLHAALAGSESLELLMLKNDGTPRPQPSGCRMTRDVLEGLGREDSLYKFR